MKSFFQPIQKSAENAKLSLGGVIDLVDAVASEKVCIARQF